MKPEEDIYYYRFLLKLSLDPEPNWWAKFHREAQAHLGGGPRAPSPFRDQARSQQTATTIRATPTNAVHLSDAWGGTAASFGGSSEGGGGGGTMGINAARQRSRAGATPSGRGPPEATAVPAAARTQRQHAALVAPVRPPAGGLNNAPSDATLSAVSTARAARETVLRNQAAVQYSTPARGQTAVATAPPMPLHPHGGGGDGDSDWGGSDAEAYIDFQRTAKTFRTWRSHAVAIKESRWEAHTPIAIKGPGPRGGSPS